MIDLRMDNVTVDLIMLDPFNPRYAGKKREKKQNEIMSEMLSTQAAKELMNSMKMGLQWVNRIVVRKIDELPDEMKNSILEADQYQYVVVEGNTRLACLKSQTLAEIYGNNVSIPVLIAERGTTNEQDFENEIKIIQARANVMIVKQWEDVPKFRHIYNMYKSERTINPTKSFSAIVDQIKNTTSGKPQEVRTAIARCIIVDKVAEEADLLEDRLWPYIEAFETNRDTRRTIGLNDNYEFVFDSDMEDYQKELINMIPDIIRDASNNLSNGKQFRDKYKQIVKMCGGNVEQIIAEIKDIMDSQQEEKTWEKDGGDVSDEQKWSDSLESICKKIKSYPVMEDWAANNKHYFEDMKIKIEKILKTL